MRKSNRISLIVLFLALEAVCGEPLAPVSVRRLDSAASSVAWLDETRLLIAGSAGVRIFSLRDRTWSDLITTTAVPDGLPDPLSVATDGRSVVANNGFTRSQFACRADSGKRLFARSSPNFMVIDVAVSGQNVYVLGWPVGPHGADNPEGIAVWRGGLSPLFEKFQPLHRIQAGPESVLIFNDSIPIYGGSLAIGPDGTLNIVTASEAGVFQYSKDAVFRQRLGARLGELVMRRMHDINVTYSVDPISRYRKVVNRQPTIDDLVVTPDGPAIVVRIAKDEMVEWELWYPNAERLDKRVKLGIKRQGPFGHISCDARGLDLMCIYQVPPTPQAAVNLNQNTLPAFLVQFRLPSRRANVTRTAEGD